MKGMFVHYDADKSENRCYRAFSQFVSQRFVLGPISIYFYLLHFDTWREQVNFQ